MKSWIAEPSRRNSGLEQTAKSASGRSAAQAALDLAAGADRHRRFGGDDGEAVEMRRELLDGREDVGQVGMAVAAAHRRADREEHDIGVA